MRLDSQGRARVPSPVRRLGLLLALVTLGLAAAPISVPASARTDPAAEVPDDLRGALTEDGRVEVLFFGSSTCGFCREMEGFLDELETRYAPPLDVVRHQVNLNPADRRRWEEELTSRDEIPSGVPTTIIGDRIWIGFNAEVGRDVARVVDGLVEVVDTSGQADAYQGPDLDADGTPATIDVPILGEVTLADRSAVGVTALIAFVDGFNPCSLWVMAVLLAMILNAGASRARIAAVGTTFLAVTAGLYGLFILGVFTVMDLLASITAITVAVGFVALFFGVVNIKDYFAYKQGLSFTIPDRFKPRIYRGGRALRDQERPLLAVLGTTMVLAAGIAIVELPCTVGFPVVWTGTLQSLGITQGPEFAGLLALYLLVYLLDELLLFAVVVLTMQVTRVEERHGRTLKLVGGSLMAVLGVAMIVSPTLLEDLTGVLVLTAGAVGLVMVLALIGRTRDRRRVETTDGRSGGARPGTGSDGADRRR